MAFRVYQFKEDKSIIALPASWVKDGKVPFGHNVTMYIKAKKPPNKNWPSYEVLPIDDKFYDSYEAAFKIEKQLLYQSDINSSDFKEVDDILRKPKKRKSLQKPKISDDNDDDDDIPIVPVKTCLSFNTEGLKTDSSDPLAEIDFPVFESKFMVSNEERCRTSSEPQPGTSTSIANLYLSAEPQAGTSKSSIDASIIRNIVREELNRFKTEIINTIQSFSSNKSPSEFSFLDYEKQNDFPLENIEMLQYYDKKIVHGTAAYQDFISYIKRFGGRSAKENVKVLNNMYSLNLQQKISYTGRENKKFAIKELNHIKLLTEILAQEHQNTMRETVLIIQIYLQQTCDRVRASNKKIKITMCEENEAD